MFELRKYKEIIASILLLSILALAWQPGYAVSSSLGFKHEKFVKGNTYTYNSHTVFIKERVSFTNLSKPFFEKVTPQFCSLGPSLPAFNIVFKSCRLSITTSILKLHCILRI